MRESAHTRRSTYTLILLGFLLAVIVFTVRLAQQRQEIRQRAQVPVVFSLVPVKSAVNVGEETTVEVQIDTGTAIVSNADLQFTFDPAFINVVSLSEGAFFDPASTLLPGTISGNTARIVVGNSASPANRKVGAGIAAVFKVRGVAASSGSVITLDPASRVSLMDGSVIMPLSVSTSITVVQSAVSADTVLSVEPSTLGAAVGDHVYLPIHIDTGINQVTKVDLAVIYDPNRFDGASITNAGFLANTAAAGTMGSGVAKIVVDSGGTGKSGKGVLVILEFIAKVTGQTTVTIDPSTFVSALNTTQNVIERRDASTITIGLSLVSPTPFIGGTCVLTRPASPTNVVATVLNSSQVLLSWNGASGSTHYGIVYGISPGVYIYGAENIGNVTSYTVSNLSPGRRYYFAVFAVNQCAPSEYSSEVSNVVSSAYSYTPPKKPAASAVVYAAPTPLGSTQVKPTPAASIGSEFKPIDPNSDALSFLAVKPRASSTASPSAESSGSNLFLYNLLWIIIAILILLIIIYILYRSRE